MLYIFQIVEINNSWIVIRDSMSGGGNKGEKFDSFLKNRAKDQWEVISMCPKSD